MHCFILSFVLGQRAGKILAGVFSSWSLDGRDGTVDLHLKDLVIQVVDLLVELRDFVIGQLLLLFKLTLFLLQLVNALVQDCYLEAVGLAAWNEWRGDRS